MDNTSDNNDFVNIWDLTGLTNITSYDKELSFGGGDVNNIVTFLGYISAFRNDMRDGCGNIILNAGIGVSYSSMRVEHGILNNEV